MPSQTLGRQVNRTNFFDGSSTRWALAVASQPLIVRNTISALLLVAVASLDTVSGIDVSFSVFYLVPVLFGYVFVSRRFGRAWALLSATVWGVQESLAREYSAAWIPMWNSLVRLTFFLAIGELSFAALLAHAREREFARTDSLTGIANGRVFSERVEHLIAQTRRHGRPFTLAYVDLDRFKHVNDEFGHAEGDRLLRTVAETIGNALRETDLIARLGGDEFGILMPETDTEQARKVLERVAQALHGEVHNHREVPATCGAITFRQAPANADFALRQADSLMYQGKAEGRARTLQAEWPDSHAGQRG